MRVFLFKNVLILGWKCSFFKMRVEFYNFSFRIKIDDVY